MNAEKLTDLASGSLHRKIATEVSQIARSQARSLPSSQNIWCHECGSIQKVDGAMALDHGWPKCCGATMTIDAPDER